MNGKVFNEDLHRRDYREIYREKLLTAATLTEPFGRKTERLDGLWQYGVDPYDTCLRARWYLERDRDAEGRPCPVDYDFDAWPVMALPCCWNLSAPELLLYEGSMVFTRRFRYEKHGNERVFLRIGAANYLCRIFLNRRYVGMHEGGSTPFCAEITDLLAQDNRILLVCDATRRDSQVPAKNTDWFNYGGIYRSIELIRLPQVFIRSFSLSLGKPCGDRRIEARVALSDPVDGEAEIRLPGLGLAVPVPVQAGEGRTFFTAEAALWSPETPVCYEARAVCREDEVRDEIGLRTIETRGNDILLNGEPVFLRGVSCHEESVPNGKALSDAERLENLRLAKALGCNFMRLAHYPHHEAMSRLADKLGLLLWEEIPVYWALDFTSDATYSDAENQLRELIARDRNRASVIIWSVGNENADTDERYAFMSRLADCARKEDPTRLVSGACLTDFARDLIDDRLAECLDVVGINEYCGWYEPDFSHLPRTLSRSRPDKPVVVTEFGADARAGHHGTRDDLGTEECQADVYARQVEVLSRIPYIRGLTPWILYDFRCPRRLNPLQDHYNIKGLLSADKRTRKAAFAVLQAFYAACQNRPSVSRPAGRQEPQDGKSAGGRSTAGEA